MSNKHRKTWKRLRPFVVAIVLLFWAAMVLIFVDRGRGAEKIELPELNIVETGEIVSESYYSVTFRGEKIGYNSVIEQKLGSGSMFHETSFYKLPVGGIEQEITSEAIITVDDSLRTKMLSFDFSSGGYNTTVNAAIVKNALNVEITTPSGSHRSSYPIEGDIYVSTVIPKIVKRQGFKKGRFKLQTFDPMTASTRSFSVNVVGEDHLNLFGNRHVWVVHLFYGTMLTTMFIDTSGTLLMEKTQEGFMSVLEDREKALNFDIRGGGSIDLLTEFSLPLGVKVIERPRDAVRFEMRIDGLETGLFDLDDFNQSWNPDSEILIVDSRGIERDSIFPKIVPEDTAETAQIQCRDRRIVAAAKKITKKADTDLERLIAINDYLFKKMDKSLTASIPSAVDVLKKMRGDCNEHTTLFLALARSLGIPSRMNVGLLYMDGYFFYHAWAQAFADGQWHSFDATLGQHPVDATHVKLTSGDLEQMLALLRFGDAQMSYIDVEYASEGDDIEQQ